jgi:hypothetical protein
MPSSGRQEIYDSHSYSSGTVILWLKMPTFNKPYRQYSFVSIPANASTKNVMQIVWCFEVFNAVNNHIVVFCVTRPYVLQMDTNHSEKHAVTFLWGEYVPPKLCCPRTKLNSVIARGTTVWNLNMWQFLRNVSPAEEIIHYVMNHSYFKIG